MRALLPAVLTLLLIPLAAACYQSGDCDSKGTPALGIVEVGDGDPTHTFYVDDRNYLLGNGLWVYEETNGVFTGGSATDQHGWSDLQVGDGASVLIPDDNDVCCTMDAPDTLIF